MEPWEIKRLSQTVINRIAAGEVIQRPVNALKELIENSLDAKSTTIQVTVKDGGLKYIQISDNGVGIRRVDLEIVCERFTTSKLREYEDLNSIATYGFRGEALASISHIAHLTILSKTSKDKCAYKACYIDGRLKEPAKPTAGNQGTQITIEDLFYNLSTRRKAFRNHADEYQRIANMMGKYAIHNAHVGFGLRKFGDSNDIKTPAESCHVDNIRTIYGNLLARELLEFNIENIKYKFKCHGYMTNANYSTKKFNFLLFINHRLVECQSLKKCMDQVFAAYLPKNTHPFVYMSLEIEPHHVDVNVHPTKHEVHFLHEEQIVEILGKELDSKLLGANSSRVFFIQSKLPHVTESSMVVTERSEERMHAKDLVRTDASEQKLEKFFGETTKKTTDANVSISAEQFAELNKDFMKKNTEFEDGILEADKNVAVNMPRTQCTLLSVLELRKTVENDCHSLLRELVAQHVFVGTIDPTHALIQHGTKLYLCNTALLMRELFYQLIAYNFANFGVIRFTERMSVKELAELALDSSEAGWTPADGAKCELADKVQEILIDKREMLNEYFAMEIDADGYLGSLPLLLENHVPNVGGLPMYVLRLATEVSWDVEKVCLERFARETALFYAQTSTSYDDEGRSWKWLVEHVFYAAIKLYLLPPRRFADNGAVLQIANLPELYRVFERC